MKSFTDYRMELRPRSELSTGLVLYGEAELAEIQFENLWKIVDLKTGEELVEPRVDFSEFSMGDKLCPSMMKPETKHRWGQKKFEQEEIKATFAKLKRMVHAQFMEQNPDLPVVQGVAETEYGRKVAAEFTAATASSKHQHSQQQVQHPYAQTGTGKSLHDEFAKEGVKVDPDEKIRTIAFNVPGANNPFTFLATACDEKWRIVEKLLAFEPDDLQLQYVYDAGGRLDRVWRDDRVVEQYQYGEQGERLVSETLRSGKRHYVYDDKLRLLKADDITYTYNAYGSLAEKKVKNRITRYEYLPNGQLCKVILPDGRIIEYVCDKRGVRTARKVNGKIVEKYKWKDFSFLEAITDGNSKNKITFTRDEESSQLVMTSAGKKFYLAVDQVGSVFMVADDQGNEVKRIIYDSFGNLLIDTNEHFYLPLGFASGLIDKDTGLVHFGFREYDPEVGRFTAQDPLGYGGGDVDVYGYCLDDPINFNDEMGLEAGGIGPIEFPPRKYNIQKWYIWKANEGACEACKKLDGKVSETPTMERPHPNCKCQQVECSEWDEFTEWEDVRELEAINITMFSPIIIKGAPVPDVKWRKYYRAEEQRIKRHYVSCGEYGKGDCETIESRVKRKEVYRYSKAYVINTGYGIETGDRGWTHNPWTGETAWFFFN